MPAFPRGPRGLRRLTGRGGRRGASRGAVAYDAGYFGVGERSGASGYATYDRVSSHADVAAYLVWRHLAPVTAIDVGCARGFLVEAERELGIDARGVDVSADAVALAADGARGHLAVADLAGRLPYDDRAADVVTVLETLEHLPPDTVPAAVAEVARIAGGHVVATIPSFGSNDHGPGGHLNGKVRWERLAHYDALGDAYDGPLPFDDLMRDAAGAPVEGHLTIASFRWWTARFADAGLERDGALERRMHPDLARFGMTRYWSLYVLRRPGTPTPPADLRPAAEVTAVERRLGLDARTADPVDLARVEAARHGPGAAVRTTGPYKTKEPGPADIAAVEAAGLSPADVFGAPSAPAG